MKGKKSDIIKFIQYFSTTDKEKVIDKVSVLIENVEKHTLSLKEYIESQKNKKDRAK